MSTAWKEGDVVAIHTKQGISDFGFVFKFHRRGECDLGLGLGLLDSGRFIVLNSYWTKTVEGCSLSLIDLEHLPKKVPDEVQFFLERHSKTIKKRGRPRLSHFSHYTSVSSEQFYKWGSSDKRPFLGDLDLPKSYGSLVLVLREIEEKEFIMKRRKNDEFLKGEKSLTETLSEVLRGKSEGFWMNPCVSLACIKFFGLPPAYFETGRKLVPEYNQLIFQVDGTDRARTLGMHRDRDSDDKEVNTILGCVAGDGSGKELIVWKSQKSVPRWWRNEGLGREAFDLAKIQCVHSPEIRDCVEIVTLGPGNYIFMPKGTWHWACPSADSRWTVMVTSSFY